MSEEYELLRSIPDKVFYEYSLRVLKNAPKGGVILDAGFGPGHILANIALANKKLNFKAKIIGIDNSLKMHELTSEELEKRKISDVELVNKHLVKFLKSNKAKFDVIHFKAILHCFGKPIEVLEAMNYALKPGGCIVTGHEESQTESRIERLYRVCPKVADEETEVIFGRYFELRAEIGKEFNLRRFPAGDSIHVGNYFISKGYKKKYISDNKEMEFRKSYNLRHVVNCFRDGTFGVFRDNLSEKEIAILYNEIIDFCEKLKIDLNKKKVILARLRQLCFRKPAK